MQKNNCNSIRFFLKCDIFGKCVFLIILVCSKLCSLQSWIRQKTADFCFALESTNLFVFSFAVIHVFLHEIFVQKTIDFWFDFWNCFQNGYYDKNKQDLWTRNKNEQDWKNKNGKNYELKSAINIEHLDTEN
jgi:hypothetical protein